MADPRTDFVTDSQDIHPNGDGRPARNPSAVRPRAVGAPLPHGSARRVGPLAETGDEASPFTPPGRALANAPAPNERESTASHVQRALHALCSAVPYAQRLLPLLDGNIVSAVANLLTLHPHKASAPANLAPIENSLTALDTRHRALHGQVAEQNASLKRVEDRLEMVREATDRNTLEQQELMEDLKKVGTKINLIALAALSLLAISVLLNLLLYLHMEHVLL